MKRAYVVGVALLAALVMGVGVAYFSDVARSDGNSFSSGELDITISKDGYRFYDEYKIFSFEGMKPGDIRTVKFYIKNKGDVPVSKVYLKFDVADREDGKLSKAEALVDNTTEEGELSSNLILTSFNVTKDNSTFSIPQYTGKSLRDLSGLKLSIFSGKLEQNEKIGISMAFKFREEAGNECQTDIADVNITVYGEQ